MQFPIKKAPSGLPKVNRMMQWTVTAKAEKAGLLACAAILSGFFPFFI